MKFLEKLERKLGKFAIPNLSLYIVICYGFGFAMNTFKPEWVDYISLNPYLILRGQVWRLFTWFLVSENSMSNGLASVFFVCLFIYFYYSIGRDLEKTWGKFYFNFYIFSGMIITVIGAFSLFAYFFLIRSPYLLASFPSGMYYINLSVFLAYAITYPNNRVYLFFMLPIKVKILGIIYIVLLAFEVGVSFMYSFEYGLISLVAVGASLLNTFIFYRIMSKSKRPRYKELKRQKEFKKKIKEASEPPSTIRHKCAICGQTDVSNPSLNFRYCSKCNGNYEYCNEHLFTHKHIQ